MITIDGLSYERPQKVLYQNISFSLEDGQHCAFIGASGSGKSTLVEMILDPEKLLYDGAIRIEENTRIGHVSQFPQTGHLNQSVFDFISEKFRTLEEKIAKLCDEMAVASDLEPVLLAYQEALDAFEAMDGDNYQNNIQKKLNLAQLGHLKDLPLSALSGGEMKLVEIIKEMLLKPNVLIMDEPDVFLDFENLEALKNLINTHEGIVLVITHNRFLLNHCFNKVIHLENTELQEFDGGYVDYMFTLLQGKIELQELSIKDDEEIERNEQLINKLRFIATNNTEASRGRALKARVKIQERLMARRVKAPFVSIKEPDIAFNDVSSTFETSDVLLKVVGYEAAFDDILLKDVNFELNYGEKVALIGLNGTGKTTFLRDLSKNKKPSIRYTEGVKYAYFSQRQNEHLGDDKTVLELFEDTFVHTSRSVLKHLYHYGFEDESILKHPFGKLSGGEKNLIQLAKIAVSPAEVLLLDEPTSHLDTYSQKALEKAIQAFKGTILMISHDYYTIANTMDYVLIIENQTIRKMSVRKFRKMIYANHFNQDYLDFELKKGTLETAIERALSQKDFELAKKHAEQLEALLKKQ